MSYRLTAKKLLLEAANLAVTICFFFELRRLLISLIFGVVGRGTTVHGHVRLFDFGNLSIGNCCTVNRYCYLDNRGGIDIGNNVNISHDCRIYTMGHDINDPYARTISGRVVIGDNAWLFPGVRIMPGVTIGEGAVIYPGSLVTRDVPPFAIMAGVPARQVGVRNGEILYSASFPVHFSV
ncbi:acyltransferase [Pseudoxanthomonas taiwanensis]|uniref:Transferase n=1 Tax=Pseudoxanthomonas taiwanensis TaxID=176598 RepID=A0A921NYW3_9GAMM|nr:acyltransferase [Pseudoxanthomonas taiwanensis]KAF1688289.1 transferase [Pseudoxanthomonas taiwanensis]